MREKWTITDIKEKIKELDKKHGMDVYGTATIRINSRLTRTLARVTSYSVKGRKQLADVEFSTDLINYGSEEQIISVLLHEYAHCMQIVRDNEANHGKTFKKYCEQLGCLATTSFSENLAYIDEKIEPEAHKPKRESKVNYVFYCGSCSAEFTNKRKTELIKCLEIGVSHDYVCPYCDSDDFRLAN